MLLPTLQQLFERDLQALGQEIEAYTNEANLWKVEKSISNSAGNLCLHLVGNLNHFIGAQLGNTGYIRHRELEFSKKDVSKNELLNRVEETLDMVQSTLNGLTEAQLEEDYPVVVFSEKMSIGFFLVHLTTHLSYHLGQINYHRRLISNE